MSEFLELLKGIVDDVRLRILFLLYRSHGLKVREIANFLGLEELGLSKILYHLKILEKNKLIIRNEKRLYFITDLGKIFVENLMALEEITLAIPEKLILLPSYPYIQKIDTKLISKLISDNFYLGKAEKTLFVKNIVEKIKNLHNKLIPLDELVQLINSVYIEKIKTKNDILQESSIYLNTEESRALNNLKKLINNYSELRSYLIFINIPSLPNFFNGYFDRHFDLARISHLIKGSDAISFSKLFLTLSHIYSDLSGGLAIHYPKLESKENFQKLRALLNLLQVYNEKKLALICKIESNDELENILQYKLFNDFSEKFNSNFDLYIKIDKSDIANISNYELLLKLFPSIHLLNVENEGLEVSSFGFFGKRDLEWLVASMISINLPRIAFHSRYNDSKFFDELFAVISLCSKIFKIKHEFSELKSKFQLNLKFYVNLLGLFETVYIHTKNTLKDKSANKFARKVINECRSMVKEISEEIGIDMAVSSINDFQSGLYFAKYDLIHDRLPYPETLRIVLRSYGYSAGVIPFWLSFNKWRDRFSIERSLIAKLDGGYSCEILLNHSSHTLENVKELLDEVFLKFNIEKVDLINIMLVCAHCSNVLMNSSKCDVCGSKDYLYAIRDIDGKIKYYKIEDFQEPRTLYLLG